MLQNIKNTVLLLVASVLWGMSFPLQSILGNYLQTNTIIFFKGLGGIVLISIALAYKVKPNKKMIVHGMLLGTVCWISLFFQQKAIELTSISKASFTVSLYIIFVPIIEIFFHKKPKNRIWLSIAIAVGGMYLLCGSTNFKFGIGEIFALISAFLFAIQIVLTAKFAKDDDAVFLTGTQSSTISILAGLIAFNTETIVFNDIIKGLPIILYIMFISGAIAQTIQTKCQSKINPSLASLIMSMESVFGTLFGWLILNQSLSLREIFGCILIFAAILLAE